MKIYTKTGDGGQTSLFSGRRVAKSHKLIESVGMLDSLNTGVGTLICSLKRDANKDFVKGILFLEGLQSQIFSVGSYLASDCKDEEYIFDIENWVSSQETYMNALDLVLPELKNFILPGGSDSSCEAHGCRVMTRQAERFIVGAELGEKGRFVVLYLNRLSDFFFVFARWINFTQGVEEPIWRS